MQPNFLVLFLAALVPLLIGFIWYSKMLFGNAWMQSAGITEETMKRANMAKVFILTYICSVLICFSLQFAVIHQYSIFSVLEKEPGINDPNSPVRLYINNFMSLYGHNFRTFQHGLLHGTLAGILLALPIISINGLFERRSAKYIFINAGFWIVCFAIMGGIICRYA